MGGEIGFGESAIEDVLTELDALRVAIDDHVPRDAERFGEGRIHSCAPALREIDYRDAMGVERAFKGPPERIGKKILRHSLDQDPAPRKEDLSARAASVEAEFFLVFGSRQDTARVAQATYRIGHRDRISFATIAPRKALGVIGIEPGTRGNTTRGYVLEENAPRTAAYETCDRLVPRQVRNNMWRK